MTVFILSNKEKVLTCKLYLRTGLQDVLKRKRNLATKNELDFICLFQIPCLTSFCATKSQCSDGKSKTLLKPLGWINAAFFCKAAPICKCVKINFEQPEPSSLSLPDPKRLLVEMRCGGSPPPGEGEQPGLLARRLGALEGGEGPGHGGQVADVQADQLLHLPHRAEALLATGELVGRLLTVTIHLTIRHSNHNCNRAQIWKTPFLLWPAVESIISQLTLTVNSVTKPVIKSLQPLLGLICPRECSISFLFCWIFVHFLGVW